MNGKRNCSFAAVSRRGTRMNNPEACGRFFDTDAVLISVAEGLGAFPQDEYAAKRAVVGAMRAFETERRRLAGPDMVARLFEAAHAEITRAGQELATAQPMRTTLMLALFDGQRLCYGHLGNSRLYLFRNKRLLRRTRDHTLAEALVQQGKLPAAGMERRAEYFQLTRYLMGGKPIPPEIGHVLEIMPGDALLLCTDGFWRTVPVPAMETFLKRSGKVDVWMQDMEQLLRDATRGKMADSYTAACAFFE